MKRWLKRWVYRLLGGSGCIMCVDPMLSGRLTCSLRCERELNEALAAPRELPDRL